MLSWIDHTLRNPASKTTRQYLNKNTLGKWKEGRSRYTWRRAKDADSKQMGKTCGQQERLAQNLDSWRKLVWRLCPIRVHRRG
ncbi:hypothetical protein DPMN_164771 [Dreissena polymorpha]|uniref:Uncharacterized protein n=1 Tax=Dreissena polymorpha TaxID=45954 RepID=A0A9D4IWE0_DREPO|nr:hypothetical protein DPMN_164771 [Dreissena polymorpha]